MRDEAYFWPGPRPEEISAIWSVYSSFGDAGCIGNGNLVWINVEWDLLYIWLLIIIFKPTSAPECV
jgi:hypothetical protein